MFKKFNKALEPLIYSRDTFTVFKDFLDLTIDNFTIPHQEPLFKHAERYTKKEYKYFDELFKVYMNTMDEQLEFKPYFDFLGEWWESDQNLTNKNTEQYFTPHDVCDLMSQLVLAEDLGGDAVVMSDCCCGSGRFALSHHYYRSSDFFHLTDIDEVAVKMCLLNCLFHGLRGVVAHMNTLTLEVFACWQVNPHYTWVAGGIPYIVPYGTNLVGAEQCLPRNATKVKKPEPTGGSLDKWL